MHRITELIFLKIRKKEIETLFGIRKKLELINYFSVWGEMNEIRF